MPVATLFEKLIRSAPALILALLLGCGSSDDDEAYYLGDEEAVREHMKEVENDERANFQKVEQAAANSGPTSATEQMFPQERPGGN